MARLAPEQRRALTHGSTLGAGVLLALALFVMVNYLAGRHYARFDWTSSAIYTLSEKSRQVVAGLDRDVELVLFMNPSSELYQPVSELLARYAAANPARVSWREIDFTRNYLEAQRLAEEHAVDRQDVVVVSAGGDRRVIDGTDMAEYDYSGTQFGQAPKLEELKAEGQITSAILELIEAEKPRILFTSGHGEASLERGPERSLSVARDLLGKDNFEIDTWQPLGQATVPPDADLVVVAGPTTPFHPSEVELLDAYLGSGGRVLVLLDPVLSPSGDALAELGLEAWLRGFGVAVERDIVLDPASQLLGAGPEMIFTASYGLHPIVEALSDSETPVLLPLARSARALGAGRDDVELVELVRSSPTGWGETDLGATTPAEAGDDDLAGPVSLAVAVSFAAGDPSSDPVLTGDDRGDPGDDEAGGEPTEPEADADQPVDGSAADKGRQARMVVIGDVDFATDGSVGNLANSLLLLNAFNWLVQREQLIDIEGRKPTHSSLVLTQSDLMSMVWIVVLLLPGICLALGIWIFFRRRR